MATIKEIRDLEIKLFDAWFKDYELFNPTGKQSLITNLSPIEKYFYMNFMKELIQSVPIGGSEPFEFTHISCQEHFDPKTGKLIKTDASPAHYYIIDFLISYICTATKKVYEVAVELDGHDFHEKTKEQAKRDKERDRDLQAHGYLVARFTGSEVYKEPDEVIYKIRGLAVKKWQRERKERREDEK